MAAAAPGAGWTTVASGPERSLSVVEPPPSLPPEPSLFSKCSSADVSGLDGKLHSF